MGGALLSWKVASVGEPFSAEKLLQLATRLLGIETTSFDTKGLFLCPLFELILCRIYESPLCCRGTGRSEGNIWLAVGVVWLIRVIRPNDLYGKMIKKLLIGQVVFFRGPLLFVWTHPLTSFAVKDIWFFIHINITQKNWPPLFYLAHPILLPVMEEQLVSNINPPQYHSFSNQLCWVSNNPFQKVLFCLIIYFPFLFMRSSQWQW